MKSQFHIFFILRKSISDTTRGVEGKKSWHRMLERRNIIKNSYREGKLKRGKKQENFHLTSCCDWKRHWIQHFGPKILTYLKSRHTHTTHGELWHVVYMSRWNEIEKIKWKWEFCFRPYRVLKYLSVWVNRKKLDWWEFQNITGNCWMLNLNLQEISICSLQSLSTIIWSNSRLMNRLRWILFI